jgi:hypothetical protein
MPFKTLAQLLGLAFLLACCVEWRNAQGEQTKRENPQEQASTVQEGPLTVCQVLQNLSLYSGKLIQIRGEWRGSALWDQCPKQIQTEDHKWPNAIYLICKESLLKREEPVDWSFGIDDYNQLWIQTLHYKLPVYATFEGRLDARAELSPNPENGGPRGPFGYGHLGYYSARIIIRKIIDILGSGFLEHPREIEKYGIDQ